ncbi:MAG: dihydrolipoyllysine-residue acetyltransferase [Xanthomonadales bacterium]|nr:dihydrolipoyllysine-residue acetyltransferase [Xanthomonadales bacterium]MCE7932756.1 dihydrolipoyllysine-residue acetyltransferase [Xanthomonadales bacterium PRO6]
MATIEAKVPDIGNYKDVPVIELLVKPGDVVKLDQGLVSLESDKATMEVPAPVAGKVLELKVKLGDTLSEGALVALIETVGGGEAKPAPAAAPAPAHAPAPAPAPQAAPAPVSAPAPAAAATPAPVSVSASASELPPAARPHASPAVRLYARELGVDLTRVSGSGRKGRITREDVQGFVKQVLAAPATAAKAPAGGGGLNLLPWPVVDFAKFGAVETQPLSRIKKISGANLARNWAMIPHVTQFDEADISEMEAFRKKLGEENKDLKLTPLVFLIKGVVAALKRFPQFNAALDASGENLVLKRYFHIGIAVDTPDGLVVPVIRDCDQKGLLDLAKDLSTMSAKARERKLGPADMSGGCFSISSLGGIGGTAFTPIINAPEVAILGVSKSSTQPVWNGSEFLPRLMLPLSLSYDHRVIDGADAARFTSFLAQQLGDVRRLLL